MAAAHPPGPSFWLGLAAAVAVALAIGFGATLHDFFLADDFSCVYVAGRASSLGEALDLNGAFRLSLVREVIPDADLPASFFRPLVTLTFWLNHLTSSTDPLGYHLFALSVHGATALLVAALAGTMGAGRAGMAAAALAFATWPITPESVTWLAARADILVGAGMGLTLLAWQRWQRDGGGAALAAVCASMFVALLAKEMAATLPGLVLVLALLFGPAPRRRLAVGVAAMAATLVAYAVLRWLCGSGFGGYAQQHVLGNVPRFVVDALCYAFLPGDRTSWPDPDAARLVGGGAWLVLLAAAAVAGRRPAALATGLLLLAFAVACAPVATWGWLGANSEGSRFLYPCLMLLAVLAGRLVAAAADRPGARAAALLAAGVLIAVHLVGVRRVNGIWHAAAERSRQIVESLREAAGDRQHLVLSNEIPDRLGCAYLGRNAFPPAVWAFLGRGVTVHFLDRASWDARVPQWREFVAENGPVIAMLRWDDQIARWVEPDR